MLENTFCPKCLFVFLNILGKVPVPVQGVAESVQAQGHCTAMWEEEQELPWVVGNTNLMLRVVLTPPEFSLVRAGNVVAVSSAALTGICLTHCLSLIWREPELIGKTLQLCSEFINSSQSLQMMLLECQAAFPAHRARFSRAGLPLAHVRATWAAPAPLGFAPGAAFPPGAPQELPEILQLGTFYCHSKGDRMVTTAEFQLLSSDFSWGRV